MAAISMYCLLKKFAMERNESKCTLSVQGCHNPDGNVLRKINTDGSALTKINTCACDECIQFFKCYDPSVSDLQILQIQI